MRWRGLLVRFRTLVLRLLVLRLLVRFLVLMRFRAVVFRRCAVGGRGREVLLAPFGQMHERQEVVV
jgi:hypothetical protein